MLPPLSLLLFRGVAQDPIKEHQTDKTILAIRLPQHLVISRIDHRKKYACKKDSAKRCAFVVCCMPDLSVLD